MHVTLSEQKKYTASPLLHSVFPINLQQQTLDEQTVHVRIFNNNPVLLAATVAELNKNY